ncbi:3'(2'),5'-bisphosphate nucleotidase CysQ [Brevundimonas balnearis]|uniref:3'(2'),5'-bisphosphate nucleotidase CysQ n=1 Tax=Brevundimonas balnearis TaxID=1572858 RepID=A0ABV6R3S8_9CAUL
MTPIVSGDPAADLDSGALEATIADLAEEAGRVILPFWRNGVAVERKADDSPVTLADQRAEALILERLAALWPSVPAVAEEAMAAGGEGRVAAWWWLIDPLDGTRGFVEGKTAFTVNIALMRGDAPAAGVVSAPAIGRTWATRGGGAVARDDGGAWRTIAVRARPTRGSMLLSHSVKPEAAARLAAEHDCAAWEGTDSSLKFCLIAEGLHDLYPREGPTSEWDTAAGQAVLEAAGGQVLDKEKARLRYGKPGFLNGPFLAKGA